jgi:hypothetical protein
MLPNSATPCFENEAFPSLPKEKGERKGEAELLLEGDGTLCSSSFTPASLAFSFK